jgi:hypothetical protein
MGTIDRAIRAVIAIVLIVLGISTKNLLMLILGVFTLFTAISGWCVMYAVLGMNTGCKKKKE